MGDVVYLQTNMKLPSASDDIFDENGFGYINGERVARPSNSYEYQMLVKRFLEEDDYKDVLLAIMDEQYYNQLEPQLQKIVEAYYYLQ